MCGEKKGFDFNVRAMEVINGISSFPLTPITHSSGSMASKSSTSSSSSTYAARERENAGPKSGGEKGGEREQSRKLASLLPAVGHRVSCCCCPYLEFESGALEREKERENNEFSVFPFSFYWKSSSSLATKAAMTTHLAWPQAQGTGCSSSSPSSRFSSMT